jgi:2-polyprenyl-6-methoxyphenol hydroxylase-like FAD-dependent oxidoreductase
MTARRLQRIGVVGAGMAGLACALAAARSGRQVTLLEAAPQPPQPRQQPGSVDVLPAMLRDLVVLGVADDCVRTGFAYRGVDVRGRDGGLLHQVPTEPLAGARYPAALGMRRADLLAQLERAALAAGVQLLRGQRVGQVKLASPPSASGASGANGAVVQACAADGRLLCEVDLLLLAVGAASELRGRVFPEAGPVQPLGQRWWYALMRRPPELERPCVVLGGTGQRVVLHPVRHDEAGLAWIEPQLEALPPDPAAYLRQALAALPGWAGSLAALIRPDTPVVQRPVYSGLLQPHWHQGPVLAVGDCAHALPPHFGQSAAQAIEDARVLGDLLGHDLDADALVQAFTARRQERARQVHQLTTTAARWDLHPEGETDLSSLMDRLQRTLAQPA